MIRRVFGLALMALLLFVSSGSVAADNPPRAVINRVGSEAQECTFPWFDKNGELVTIYLAKMEVYPNNRHDNLLFKCSTTLDYGEYATIEEACEVFPDVWGFDPCNKKHNGAMLLSGGNSGFSFSDLDFETGELLKCTYNWTAVFAPSGNVEINARFTPQSTVPADQCQ
jgi:hypothetical protein